MIATIVFLIEFLKSTRRSMRIIGLSWFSDIVLGLNVCEFARLLGSLYTDMTQVLNILTTFLAKHTSAFFENDGVTVCVT